MTNRFLSQKVKRAVKFMGLDLEIVKLSVADVLEIQRLAKDADKDEQANLQLVAHVVRMGAPELKELTDDEIQTLPLDELSVVSNEIMKFSGLTEKK